MRILTMPIHMAHLLLLHTLAVGAYKNLSPVLLPAQRLPGTPMEATSHQPRGLFEHEQRNNMNTTVNWATMPSCGGSPGCAGVNGSAIPGNDVNFTLPCPIVAGNCSDNGTVYQCPTYELDCYCNLPPLQLLCPWIYCETWFLWMSVEDWFQQQCPSVQPLNFTQIPSCASQCVQNAAFYSGCVTSGRNCFCDQQSFFGCDSGCDDSDMSTIIDWYAQNCSTTYLVAEQIIVGNTSNVKGALGTATVPTGIHWYEGIAIATAGLSMVLLVVGWIYNPIMRQKIRRENEKTHAE